MADSETIRLRSETARKRVDGAVIATVAFDGDLDLPSVEVFRAALSPGALGDADGVILDLVGLRFIDSSGIHALLRAWKELGVSGTHPKVVIESGSNAERVLAMTGLLDRFEPVPDQATAVDAIAGGD